MVWNKATEIRIDGTVPLAVYHSNRSNMRVFVAETPGPIVEGRITFVTETHTNYGLPHTLEHLVFMGSKLYPYKGALDFIANRCLGHVNACTFQNLTSYELTTSGSSGFLKVLPVYLDHLLTPTQLSVLDADRLDPNLLESAKRSLVCELITGLSTVKLTVTSAILAIIRSVGTDFTLKLCLQIWHANADDVLSIGGPAIRRLFDASKSVRSIALSPSRQKELEAYFPETEIVKLDQLQVKTFLKKDFVAF